MNTRI